MSKATEIITEMARKVTDDIASALKKGKKKKIANTETDGKSVWLHGNEIVKVDNGEVSITDSGWDTPTTKERINGILSMLGITARVSKNKGTQILKVDGKSEPWDGRWIKVGSIK